MGSNVCKTLHLPLTSQQQRRNDLKDSRFDQNDNNHNNRNGGGKRSLNFGIHNSKKQGKIKQRVQVQPITERLVEVNTSYLDHIQSNIRMDDKNNFIEQLNCSYCEKKIFTDNKNDVLDHNSHHSHKNHPRTPSPDTTLTVRPEVMNIPSIEDDDDDDKKLIATTSLSDRSADEKKSLSDSIKVSPSGSQSSSSSSCSSSSSSSPQRNVDPFPIINEHENDDDNNTDKPGSISPILYRSVSTIPMCLEEEEEEENEEEEHDEHGDSINELPKKMDKSTTKNNQFMAITNEKFPRKKCRSLPRLDSKFNLLIQNWSDLDLLTKEFVKTGDKMNNNNEKNGEEFCEFCEYIKGGGADKTSTWTNLDKDVTMLIDMADRLGMMIMEKEKDKEISGGGGSAIQNKSALLLQQEDIVEEKKVSLSYLEKLNNSMDLKQKVHFLRKKRQVGISVMKTSGGKCLMDFNDGQNSYQIQSRFLFILFYFIYFFEIF